MVIFFSSPIVFSSLMSIIGSDFSPQSRKTNLSERDKFICSTIGPELRKRDLFFVGIDVIGDYLTEINVTSPTGIREIENLNNINIAKLFWEYLEKKLID